MSSCNKYYWTFNNLSVFSVAVLFSSVGEVFTQPLKGGSVLGSFTLSGPSTKRPDGSNNSDLSL